MHIILSHCASFSSSYLTVNIFSRLGGSRLQGWRLHPGGWAHTSNTPSGPCHLLDPIPLPTIANHFFCVFWDNSSLFHNHDSCRIHFYRQRLRCLKAVCLGQYSWLCPCLTDVHISSNSFNSSSRGSKRASQSKGFPTGMKIAWPLTSCVWFKVIQSSFIHSGLTMLVFICEMLCYRGIYFTNPIQHGCVANTEDHCVLRPSQRIRYSPMRSDFCRMSRTYEYTWLTL